MPPVRVFGVLFLALLGLSLVAGAASRGLLFGSFAAAAACVVSLAVLVRKGLRARGLLALAAISALLYICGGIYLMYWSPETDIGGGIPFLVGLVGMLVVSLTMTSKDLGSPQDERDGLR